MEEVILEAFEDNVAHPLKKVKNTRQAIELIREQIFDLIISDIRLVDDDPEDSGGMYLLQYIHENRIPTKMIILSAYGTSSQMRYAFRSGIAVDFLDKSDFDVLEFRQIISKYIPGTTT